MKILLIAGHGGTPYDSGAVGCGYTEAVETRRMAMAVAPKLKKYGFSVEIYDQSRDAYKVVTQGGSLPLSGVGYALEFHLNSAANDRKGNGRTTGSEIFVHPSEDGVGVEQAILKRLSALGFTNRGVKRNSSFAVLRHVRRRGVSHALIETCFIDDADDMKLYKNKFYEIADAIADGVAEGFGREVDDMSYEQFCAFMARYEKERAAKSPSAWSAGAWQAAQDAGITDGISPQGAMTREMGVVMLERCGLVGRKER